jgi:hypothetical protein
MATTAPVHVRFLASPLMRRNRRIHEKRGTEMTFKRALCASTLTAGVGLAGLLGVGLGTASADPWHDCDRPGAPPCGNNWNNGPGNNWNNGPVDWHGRGIDQGRFDHQPFNWNGQQVYPVPAGDGNGWGFWFFGTWIPL